MVNNTAMFTQYTSIEEKIRLAKKLYLIREKILDMEIEKLLLELDKSIQESKTIMDETGITDACKECGEFSCCGKGIEERFEVTTLLINLFLGVELSKGDAEGCYFLTRSGCSLKAREVICVNYLCEKIYRKLKPEDLITVQEVCGRELDILFLLSERIKEKIRKILEL
ncbi:hypothetical protein DRP07_11180 [Archaeoglobales archaeon]|nr:MAG: hypothetical protein DRP07_11180 [Archaeoglobales archaeon]